MISPYLEDGLMKFGTNVPQVKSFLKIRGQRSRSWPDRMLYTGRGMHFDGVKSRLNC